MSDSNTTTLNYITTKDNFLTNPVKFRITRSIIPGFKWVVSVRQESNAVLLSHKAIIWLVIHLGNKITLETKSSGTVIIYSTTIVMNSTSYLKPSITHRLQTETGPSMDAIV